MWIFIKELFGFFEKKEKEMPKVNDTRREDIAELYRSILGREPDKEGLDWWVSTPSTLEEIKAEFLKSEEYTLKVRTEQVNELYLELFGRTSDAEGLKFWVNGPLSIDEIRLEFLKSEEYLAKITPTAEPDRVADVKIEPSIPTKTKSKVNSKVAKGRPKKSK